MAIHMKMAPDGFNSIVHINTNDIKGGAAKFVRRLHNSQKEQGLDSKMIVGFKESDSSDIVTFPIKINLKVHKFCIDKSLLYYSLNGSHKLIEHPLITSTGIIHFHNLHGGYFNPFSLSGLSCHKPSVWTLHDMHPITGHCISSFDCDRWETGCSECQYLEAPVLLGHKKLIYDHSILNIVTPTKWMERMVGRSILKDHRVQTIYHGIDTSLFSIHDKKAMREKHGIPQNKVIIGTVAYGGAFGEPGKGGYFTKKCLEALDESGIDYAFVNIGSESIKEYGPKIINIGYVTEEQKMAELYSALDIFLFPSLAETFGLAAAEAMSCGVPVIAFNYGALGELVIDNKTGLLVDYKDDQMLARATIELATNESLRDKFSHNARALVCERFEIDRMTREYSTLYYDCIKNFNKHDKKSKIFLLDSIPEIIKSDEFYDIESSKTDKYNKRSLDKKPFRISVIYNPGSTDYINSPTYISILNQTYKNISINIGSIRDVNLEDLEGELIYYINEGYVVGPDFLNDIITQYNNEDAICCMLELYRENGTSFYKAVFPDVYLKDEILKINACKYNNIVFKKGFFIDNILQILQKEYISINKLDLLNFKLVKTKVSKYIEDMTESIGNKRIFIYGAGGHTMDLLNSISSEKINVSGIIDRNPELENSTINGMTVYNVNKMKDLNIDYIIISSASYESEIFDALRKEYKEEKLITIYGGLH